LRRFYLIPSQNGTARLTGCPVVSSLRFSNPLTITAVLRTACSAGPTRGLGIAVKFVTLTPIFRRSGLKTRPSRFRAQSMTRTAAELRLRRPTCCLSSKITQTSDRICPGSHDNAEPRRGPCLRSFSCPFCDASLFLVRFAAKIAIAAYSIRLLHHSQLH
jgi:hypothetical protein